jgi:hypothetical protein
MHTTNEYWADKKHPQNLLGENNHVVCLRTKGSPAEGIDPFKLVYYYDWSAGIWQFSSSASELPTTSNMEVYDLGPYPLNGAATQPLEVNNQAATYNQSNGAQAALLGAIANELQLALPSVTFCGSGGSETLVNLQTLTENNGNNVYVPFLNPPTGVTATQPNGDPIVHSTTGPQTILVGGVFEAGPTITLICNVEGGPAKQEFEVVRFCETRS